jgi:hypothetical protein
MAISIIVNNSRSPKNVGFLLAPVGKKQFPTPVALKSTDGTTVKATLAIQAPAGVAVQLSKTNVSIGPTGTNIKITAKGSSKKAGDIKLLVKVKSQIKASYVLTAMSDVRLHFAGRFQARFATDSDFFNEPRGTSAGWQFALEGEPDFVPSTNNIPTQPGMAVGRVVRFQNPVMLRTHVAPVGVTIKAVEGKIGASILTSKTVLLRRISEMIRNTACTMTGARPSEGSSSSSSRGFAIRPRATATICNCPPDKVQPSALENERISGNRSNMASASRDSADFAMRRFEAPSMMFSLTDRPGKIRRPSGT